ncbi:hypothetical protein SAMN05660484_02473 [Eubacterium ruminantium]|uniref:hypothetical protein n=1 Tax=Eubacterium ruminantium TaxID=42322 RepID=UPI00087123F3|nr:hypothetical protein [Eubacterium ruminantium]SCW67891.1 hypothetical protein SAMN05660484_02473 [Eubacterium ruminantium]SDN40165.1 hypothetical protein SAMN04490370_12110 [Eubacterium ruminantium]
MRAKWHVKPRHDLSKKKWIISFEVEDAPEVYDKTKNYSLTLDVKRFREKRSLEANAYFHVLVDKIAKELKSSEVEVKNLMLSRYGQIDQDVNHIILKDSIDAFKLAYIHLRPTSKVKKMDNNELYRVHLVIRGSHTYNTEEMSELINGTVFEAKELGIETLPDDEIERMVATWKAS